MSPEFSGVAFDERGLEEILARIRAHSLALIANGENALLVSKVALEPVTVRQRKFLHGPVLGQIAEQVRIEGHRYPTDVWKTHYRKLFLPDEWVVEPGFHKDVSAGIWIANKRATPRRVHRSTEDLGVRGYSEFTEKVIADATVEWGVVFHFTSEEQALRRPPPKGRHV